MCELLVGLPDVASYSRHPGEVGAEAGRPGDGVPVERPAVDLLVQ
jgi:hypothetical protein